MFEHRLCALLGLTLGEVQSMGSTEYDRWLRYWQQEPWGPWRDNMHAALIVSKLHNIHKKKSAKAATPDDFMLRDRQSNRDRQTGQTLSWLIGLARKKNGDGSR